MFFRQFIHEERSCLSYMIGCQTRGVVAVLDPQADAAFYLQEAERARLKIERIIDTHTQADHVSGALTLAEEASVPIVMHREARVEFPFEAVNDGDVFSIGNREFRVIATPGHTSDSMCLYVDGWYLLTGDTLFVSDVGRVDLTLADLSPAEQRENARTLYRSLKKLLVLPDWTEIYPSHFRGSSCGKGLSAKMISTIGREKQKNRALALDEETFVEYVTTDTPPPPLGYRGIKLANIHGAAELLRQESARSIR